MRKVKTEEQDRRYEQTQMQKENIIQQLRERGCRITKQRLILLDIILKEECSCCKEIYYKASKIDKNIGAATVYRMVNVLEEIGAVSRRHMYWVECEHGCDAGNVYIIEFDDDTRLEVAACMWDKIVQAGLENCGYAGGRKVRRVTSAQVGDVL